LIKLHIVLATKYRKKILKDDIDSDIKKIICEVAQTMEFGIDTMESDRDHIHILVDIPPKLSPFQVVHQLKQITTFKIYKIGQMFTGAKGFRVKRNGGDE